jgi:hypothetical protein
MREPQNMRLMMSTVRELVHDVLDLRAEGETEGERREIPEAEKALNGGETGYQEVFRSKSGEEERRTGKDIWTSESGPA